MKYFIIARSNIDKIYIVIQRIKKNEFRIRITNKTITKIKCLISLKNYLIQLFIVRLK